MVKLYGTGEWGSVCDDAFDVLTNPDTYQETGNVACRSLGFSRMVKQDRSLNVGITGKIRTKIQSMYY